MIKTFSFVVLILGLILVIGALFIFLRGDEDTWICQNGQWVAHGHPNAPQPSKPCGEENSNETGPIVSFDDCVSAGYSVMESYPRQCRTPEGDIFTEYIGNELEKTDLIRIDYPRPNQPISSPLYISGEARGSWFFEASFPVKLLDKNDNLLATGIAQAQDEWMTENFVPFTATLEFDSNDFQSGILILVKDNPSGLPENDDQLIVPVKFENNPETMTFQVFFGNSDLDPDNSCDKVFAVTREVDDTPAVARAALTELLSGPTSSEESAGYFTSINPNVNIQSLVIDDGTAMVDFDETLGFEVGGSCRVSAIRAQIVQTLTQFATVDDVVISIDGRTEDILQP